MTRHKKPHISVRSIYQWHRYVGLTAALFIIIIAVTGILLNHTTEFKFNKQYVKTNWLLNHYGITAPQIIPSYPVANNWISQWDNQIYLNKKFINKNDAPVIGAISYNDMIIIGQPAALLVFTATGELIERVAGSEGIPSGIEAIGITDEKQLAVRSSTGIFTTNQDLLFWQNSPAAIVVWSDNVTLPDSVHKTLLELYRGQGLNLERILLDLHSGRLLGKGGVYFMDFIALLMILLALSGVWLWIQRIIKTRKHKKQRHH
jgi:cytochrome b subunit of formate dehydrogenase